MRRAVPQLILEGLGTRFHLAVAEDIENPFLRPPTTYNRVVYATQYALQSERECIAQRLDVAETLQVLADAVYSENLQALLLVDPFLLPVVARRNFLVMREVSVVISWMDPKLIVDLFFGLPQLGWAMPAPTMQLREAPPEYPIEALKADCGSHNSKLISRCRCSGDDNLDNAAWEKTEEELSSEMILGPFFDLQDVPFPFVRLLRRFGTWEQRGGAENPTVRLIDDALEGGQNGATGSQFTHRPTDLDSWATQCRMVQERFPQSPLSHFPSDFKKGVQTSSSGTKFGRLCCNGTMAPAETLSCVPGGPYTILWWKVLPSKFRESSRLVLPRLGFHGWLGHFALCGRRPCCR